MKKKKFWLTLLLACLFAGSTVPILSENRFAASAAEGVEVVETDLSGNVTYNTTLYITKNMNLNGHTMTVNGDLEIAADVVLNKGILIVNGNILHTNGAVIIDKGILQVSGDYRIQDRRIMPDGTTQYLESDGRIRMQEADGILKIGGDFITQSNRHVFGNNYTGSNCFSAGTMEVGGDLIQLNGNEKNFSTSGSHKVILTGNNVHHVEFASNSSGFQNLESEGTILWNGYLRIGAMVSDLEVQAAEEGDFLLGFLNANGKYMNIKGDTSIIGDIATGNGFIKINGDVLHTDGVVILGGGTIEVTGDYRIQDIKTQPGGTTQYTESNGRIRMQEAEGILRIGGDFVTQSNRHVYGNNYTETNCFSAGTMEIGGDLIQLNGNDKNFSCGGSHKVILNGSKAQKVEFESQNAGFAALAVTRALSSYTFSRTPCWNTLEESAVSITECTIKSIAKKTYTGKALKPALTITYNGTKLVKDTDYTVKYSNNKNTGKATVTITGIGVYTGETTKNFNIVPAKITGIKVSSSASKTAVITWEKNATASGYVIEYSTDKSFQENVGKVTIKKNTTVSRSITKLTSKKTYYFRIRPYKTIDGKKVYGSYSSVVNVKIK